MAKILLYSTVVLDTVKVAGRLFVDLSFGAKKVKNFSFLRGLGVARVAPARIRHLRVTRCSPAGQREKAGVDNSVQLFYLNLLLFFDVTLSTSPPPPPSPPTYPNLGVVYSTVPECRHSLSGRALASGRTTSPSAATVDRWGSGTAADVSRWRALGCGRAALIPPPPNTHTSSIRGYHITSTPFWL